MLRVPVISAEGKPLMPTKASRARGWVRDGKAVEKWNDAVEWRNQSQKRIPLSWKPDLATPIGRSRLKQGIVTPRLAWSLSPFLLDRVIARPLDCQFDGRKIRSWQS